jgi:nicotinamidase-related amidase
LSTRRAAGRRQALLIIDMISAFDFPEGPALAAQAVPAARRIARLKRRVRMPVIYANDNFMRWQADFREIVATCMAPTSRGANIARLLEPGQGDYFILKPKHSAFYQAPLEALLDELRVTRLVLTGIAADGCVPATAADAHLREYGLRVPADCVASPTQARTRHALAVMKSAFHADTAGSRGVR